MTLTLLVPALFAFAADARPPSFLQDVQPILTRFGCNSGACHGALAGKGGLKLSLRGYDSDADLFALTRQALARRVDRDAPGKSLILQKAIRSIPHGGGRRFEEDSEDYAILLEWIKAGAKGPDAKETALLGLEIEPKTSTLEPKGGLQLKVFAKYADGRKRDVTHWARFGSAYDATATVSEEGAVKAAGHGEAAIHAGFGSSVAIMTVSVPYPNPASTAKPARNNWIDDHVNRKLDQLRLPASPACSDNEFIRRAYLDAAGILPTPEDTDKFVSDKAPDKRAKLIDALLERPEYIDYWAYKWSDLLLVSTRRLPQSQMWSFHRHIRQGVADNKPWDRFARDLLTATGSTLQNGGGNFYVLHKDVADLTESTAVTFLGMSITCARCHNHPLEKWTQDQYWQLANLFSRVDLKNGDRSGEVLVQSATEGEALHPRRGVPMAPTPLGGKAMANDDPRDRRAHFADWLTAAENPYFAKALVNRVWRNFMGRGLVEAEDDLRETNPATNVELFDALASDFAKNGYDVMRLVKLVMNSAAYQRSSKPVPGNGDDNRYYSRFLVKRLSGEVILDALSQVTASPTVFNQVYTGVEGGTAATTNYPMGTRAMQLPDSRVASRFLDAFGRPDRVQTCSCERSDDATVGQALMLNNGQALNDKLRAKDARLAKWIAEKLDDTQAVDRVFSLALSRKPTDAERAKLLAVLKEAPDRQEAFEDLFWAVLTTREFLFNH